MPSFHRPFPFSTTEKWVFLNIFLFAWIFVLALRARMSFDCWKWRRLIYQIRSPFALAPNVTINCRENPSQRKKQHVLGFSIGSKNEVRVHAVVYVVRISQLLWHPHPLPSHICDKNNHARTKNMQKITFYPKLHATFVLRQQRPPRFPGNRLVKQIIKWCIAHGQWRPLALSLRTNRIGAVAANSFCSLLIFRCRLYYFICHDEIVQRRNHGNVHLHKSPIRIISTVNLRRIAMKRMEMKLISITGPGASGRHLACAKKHKNTIKADPFTTFLTVASIDLFHFDYYFRRIAIYFSTIRANNV